MAKKKDQQKKSVCCYIILPIAALVLGYLILYSTTPVLQNPLQERINRGFLFAYGKLSAFFFKTPTNTSFCVPGGPKRYAVVHVAVDGEHVIISDRDNSTISIFDKKGTLIHNFGERGEKLGQFINPCGVAVDDQHRIFIADHGNRRIQIFDEQGNFISSFGDYTLKGRPYGIAFDAPRSRIIVTEWATEAHQVSIFDFDFQLKHSFGKRGIRNGEFAFPLGVAVNEQGDIFVADWDNHRIQVFDENRKFLFTFGSRGEAPGFFRQPWGITVVKGSGEIIVTDYENHRIQVFNSNATFLRSYPFLFNPEGLVYDDDLHLIVGGSDGCLSIFSQ